MREVGGGVDFGFNKDKAVCCYDFTRDVACGEWWSLAVVNTELSDHIIDLEI